MRITICSNITNGIGLQREYLLLRQFLESRGHTVRGHQFDEPAPEGTDDLCIWIEVVAEHLLGLGHVHWLFANPEWLRPSYVRFIQRHVSKIFAKTHAAVTDLQTRFPKVHYVGFLSEDRRDLTVARSARFLHLGGNSGFRNTPAVIEAWRSYRYWNGRDGVSAPLTVVTNSNTVVREQTPDITFHKRLGDEEIRELQNSHLYHILPSAYEGYGHATHEAQSVGAILLTTSAGPMSELHAPFEVPSVGTRKNNLGILHAVSPADIRAAVPKMLALPNYEIARMQVEARARWENGNREFGELFSEHLDALRPRAHSYARPRLAILGNFEPEHSTENELLWTLGDMGYQVIPFQENKDTTDDIVSECKNSKVALLVYVSTHGWVTPGTMSVDEMLDRLAEDGTKTASFHLDRYWGLNINDKREDLIGTHPFWRTDYVFTADGGNQDRFRERGINHYWLPPGVVKRDCYFGQPQEELITPIGFVGARGYHPEYPFREQLISFLEDTYGDRFRLFQGYRGEALNNLYSSISVVVGDSCFGGADYYWSDRVPETLGRGGFLIHPASRGLTIPGLVTYSPGDLAELADRIDYYLARPEERDALRAASQAWVRENETYHNRMRTMLKIVGIE